MKCIELGIKALVREKNLPRILNRRVGLVAHPASTAEDLTHTLDFLKAHGVAIEIIFGPEHGFMGDAQDMEPVNGRTAHPSGIPVVSLYGSDLESLSPRATDLTGLDVLIVDLADVGSRYYTFIWTALLCLRVCHFVGVEMILTDRPNPLGGELVEGAPQDPDYLSFVGLFPVSNRHGMTPGEVLYLAARQEGLADALHVQRMTGWRRSMTFEETGIPWVMPSPNMPTLDTALVYPGMCLLEATWASEGRGTTRPFELFGAPGISGSALKARLDGMGLEGVRFRPAGFKPGFHKHRGAECGGVQIHVTEPGRFRPYRTGIAVLLALKAEAKEAFEWRHEPYEFVVDRPAIDLLTGSSAVREMIESGATLEEISAVWETGETEFREYRRDFLLY